MTLCSLFHYNSAEKKHKDLQKGLKEYRFLLKTAKEAIESLERGLLEKFDSLVGENACQIRAVKIALIASGDLDSYSKLKEKIQSALQMTESLLSSIGPLMQSGKSLKDVLIENQLEIPMNAEQHFVIQSYILSEMKESLSDGQYLPSIFRVEKSVPQKLQKNHPEISYSFINRLASRLRRLLSESSVLFVKNAARGLDDPSLLKMVSEYSAEHNSWPCTPMFWTYKTLLNLAQREKIPFILHVKFLKKQGEGFEVKGEEYLYFRPCDQTGSYREVPFPMQEDGMGPACVVQGAVCEPLPSKDQWREKFLQNSVVDVILAGAADHRQYPDPNRVLEIDDPEFERYKRLAANQGFSLDNPTTFFIQHVYSTKLAQKTRCG